MIITVSNDILEVVVDPGDDSSEEKGGYGFGRGHSGSLALLAQMFNQLASKCNLHISLSIYLFINQLFIKYHDSISLTYTIY